MQGKRKREEYDIDTQSHCYEKLLQAMEHYTNNQLNRAHEIVSVLYRDYCSKELHRSTISSKIMISYHLFRYEIEKNGINNKENREKIKLLLIKAIQLTYLSNDPEDLVFRNDCLIELCNIKNKCIFISMNDDMPHSYKILDKIIHELNQNLLLLSEIKKTGVFDINKYRMGDIFCTTKFLLAYLKCARAKVISHNLSDPNDTDIRTNKYSKDPKKDLAIKIKISDKKYIEVLDMYPELFEVQKNLCPRNKGLEMKICLLFLLLTKHIRSDKSSEFLKTNLLLSKSRGINQNLIDCKIREAAELYYDRECPTPLDLPQYAVIFAKKDWDDLTKDIKKNKKLDDCDSYQEESNNSDSCEKLDDYDFMMTVI